MYQTEYKIKLGNITSNYEATNAVSKISSEIENANHKRDESWRIALITQTMRHCHAFSKNFKSLTKGDWVVSTIFELDSISNNLKNNLD